MVGDRFGADLLRNPGPRAPVRVPRAGIRINWPLITGLIGGGFVWWAIFWPIGRAVVTIGLQVAAWAISVTAL